MTYVKRDWGLIKRMVIPDDATGEPYMVRTQLLQTPYFGVQLNAILTSDGDRAMHDHPRAFLSLILRGGYTERYGRIADGSVSDVRTREWRRMSVHRVGLSMAHTITHVRPRTVTLVVKGPFRRDWGFYTDDGFVDWRHYKAGSDSA